MPLPSFGSRRKAPAAKGLGTEAFERLYDAHAAELLVFFRRRTGDAATARDLWAETLAQAFAGRRRFRGETDAEAVSWLYGIAYRQLAQSLRRGYAERRALERLALDPPALSDADVERLEELAGSADLRGMVRAAMEELPAAQREALRLRVVDGLTHEQVAARLQISPGASRVRVSRALRGLAAGVERRKEEEGAREHAA